MSDWTVRVDGVTVQLYQRDRYMGMWGLPAGWIYSIHLGHRRTDFARTLGYESLDELRDTIDSCADVPSATLLMHTIAAKLNEQGVTL